MNGDRYRRRQVQTYTLNDGDRFIETGIEGKRYKQRQVQTETGTNEDRNILTVRKIMGNGTDEDWNRHNYNQLLYRSNKEYMSICS